jgi:hypothetical protein
MQYLEWGDDMKRFFFVMIALIFLFPRFAEAIDCRVLAVTESFGIGGSVDYAAVAVTCPENGEGIGFYHYAGGYQWNIGDLVTIDAIFVGEMIPVEVVHHGESHAESRYINVYRTWDFNTEDD